MQDQPDFIIEVAKDKQPTVLFLADPQTIDADRQGITPWVVYLSPLQ